MGKYQWLTSLYRRHFLSSSVVISTVNRGDWCRQISTLHNDIKRDRFLNSCNFLIGQSNSGYLATTKMQLLTTCRCIHATGTSNARDQSYYEILGVSENASQDEIKNAFISLAKQYHPDVNNNNPSAKGKFQEIREAYGTLRDAEKRKQYDIMRKAGSSEKMEYGPGFEDFTDWFRGGAENDAKFRHGAGTGRGFSYTYQTSFSNAFEKIFSEVFEDFRRDAYDIHVDLMLSFTEAAKGCTKRISLDALVPCDTCDGRGFPINAETRVCPTCRGRGKISIPPFTSTCSSCKGSGQVVEERCVSCLGSGAVESVKEVEVTVPAGVQSGDSFCVREAGNIGGQGRQPGDLYITFKVDDDPVFSRDGLNVYVDANISFTQAILGGKIEVPTLFGKVQVEIPKGVQPGEFIVLRGKGVRNKQGFFTDQGDQFVRFRINFPTTLNERQRAILEEFAKEEINNENGTSTEEKWLEHLLERMMSPKFMLEFSLVMIILLSLYKIMG